jgi:hypothetical protein
VYDVAEHADLGAIGLEQRHAHLRVDQVFAQLCGQPLGQSRDGHPGHLHVAEQRVIDAPRRRDLHPIERVIRLPGHTYRYLVGGAEPVRVVKLQVDAPEELIVF